MDVSCPSSLKFYSVADVPDPHWVVAAKDNLLPESFDPMLEVAGGQEHVPLHHVMHLFVHVLNQVLLPGYLGDLVPNFLAKDSKQPEMYHF